MVDNELNDGNQNVDFRRNTSTLNSVQLDCSHVKKSVLHQPTVISTHDDTNELLVPTSRQRISADWLVVPEHDMKKATIPANHVEYVVMELSPKVCAMVMTS